MFLSLLALVSSYIQRTEADGLVHLNGGIIVGRGQYTYVTDNDLQFNIPKTKDSCKVEVVLNEPITQRVGKLTPQVFDCHFLPHDVKYTHNGCPLLEEDNVMLRIYRFTESQTFLETFLLNVQITEPKSSLIKFGLVSLQVQKFYGISNPIDKNVVSFKYNANSICTVKVLSTEALVPAHGQLIVDDPQYRPENLLDTALKHNVRKVRQATIPCPSNKACPTGVKEVRFLKTNCEDFLAMGLKYQHLSPPSPNNDYIPIRVEVRDERTRFLHQVENAWIRVNIKGAIPNQQPKAAFMSMYILEVDQFILTPLSMAAVDAQDDETPKDRLVFNITKPPVEGYLTHLDDHTKSITSFSWQDLHEMKIAYQPPNISHTERRNCEVDFKAIDTFFEVSDPIMVHFSIRTAETNAPRVSWNMGHPVTTFLQRDLFQGLIYYHHFGGEVFEDSFEFILSDSHEPPNLSDPQITMIHVTPVKDQLPKEVDGTMRYLVVKETEIRHITKNHLHFTDTESPENELMYIITKPCFFPTNQRTYDAGKIIFTDSTKNMKKDPSVPMLKSFTQHAVNHMKVAYMPPHGDIGPHPLLVQLVFSVNDQQGGALTGLVFNITIMPVDNQPPEIFTNDIKAEEGSGCMITADNVMVTDKDTLDEALRIQMKQKPQHGDIEHQGNVMLEGDMFTLDDLKFFQVRYKHDDSETLHDLVVFTATDGFNTADEVLKVKIIPINDEPPELQPHLKSGLQCPEGEMITITAEYLYATDTDSGEIGYSSCMDTVTVIVSDAEAGTVDSCCYDGPLPPPVPLHGSLPFYDLNITVMPVNNQPPTIKIGDMFTVDEASQASLVLECLSATDEDTITEELIFVLESLPQYGYVENTLPSPGYEKSNAGKNIASFSLQHLRAGYINYVQCRHNQMEPTADHFMMSVSDAVHKSKAVPFYVIINPINDETPDLHLGNITVSMETAKKEK
ncbi:hypothetical protein scyTo_0004468 [Scyliorhinus torazame]|uniref:FRAS1-related extracellular matrix protein N-terminal domain-containing protein n=1 Tax=Scyliorhinus torazame TaxID=75743 RepID=A0A401NS44_SCYTO|nr:hypothetical protein [Scyliorhinus torazame]